MKVYQPHQSVLARECLRLLSPEVDFNQREKFWMVDCTFGAGGHSLLFLNQFPHLNILGIDQDHDAISNAKKITIENKVSDRVILVHSNMEHANEIIRREIPNEKILIILADLGVSSHHFDDAGRGFSYKNNGPLDMRMDHRTEITAHEIVNTYQEEELESIFTKYGEEPFARKIAAMIIRQRKISPLETTAQLEEVCFLSYPPALRHRGKHPAVRVFQALRLFINKELEILESTLPILFENLSPRGKLGVISFHSLEDRIVKHQFLNWSKVLWSSKCAIMTKKPIVAGQDELLYNPRSRSAKLRVIQKLE